MTMRQVGSVATLSQVPCPMVMLRVQITLSPLLTLAKPSQLRRATLTAVVSMKMSPHLLLSKYRLLTKPPPCSIPPLHSLSPKTNRSAPSWANLMRPIRMPMPPLLFPWLTGTDRRTMPSSPWIRMARLQPPHPSIMKAMPRPIPSVCKPRMNTTPQPKKFSRYR